MNNNNGPIHQTNRNKLTSKVKQVAFAKSKPKPKYKRFHAVQIVWIHVIKCTRLYNASANVFGFIE
jgi:hypothetical protein